LTESAPVDKESDIPTETSDLVFKGKTSIYFLSWSKNNFTCRHCCCGDLIQTNESDIRRWRQNQKALFWRRFHSYLEHAVSSGNYACRRLLGNSVAGNTETIFKGLSLTEKKKTSSPPPPPPLFHCPRDKASFHAAALIVSGQLYKRQIPFPRSCSQCAVCTVFSVFMLKTLQILQYVFSITPCYAPFYVLPPEISFFGRFR
jgi:hypothetical protein